MVATIYLYAEDRQDQEFLADIDEHIGVTVTDYGPGELNIISLEIDDAGDADLEAYMKSEGFSKLGTSPTIINGVHHWGAAPESETPTLAIQGDLWVNKTTDRLNVYGIIEGGALGWEPMPHLHEGGLDADGYLRTPFGGFGRHQNLLRFSEQLDNDDVWTLPGANASVSGNDALAPNGEQTADTVTWTAAGVGLRQSGVGVVNAQEYTCTFWARYVSGATPELTFSAGNGTESIAIEIRGTEMTRYTATFTAGAGGDFLDIHHADTDGVFELWGLQFVDGENNYPYVKTSDAPLADVNVGATVAGHLDTTDGLRIRGRGAVQFGDGSLQAEAATPDSSTWHVATIIESQSFGTVTWDSQPTGLWFNVDGTRMLLAGSLNNQMTVFILATAWDISTAGIDTQSSSFNSPRSCAFSPDGLTVYDQSSTSTVRQRPLTIAYDLNSIGAAETFSTAAQDAVTDGLHFSSDGRLMFITGGTNDSVYSYELSTPWDITTAVFWQSLDVSTETTIPRSVHLKGDGRTMFVLGTANNTIFEYSLSTPFDITTAALVDQRRLSDDVNGQFFDIHVSPSGHKLYVVDNQLDRVIEHDMGLRSQHVVADQLTATVAANSALTYQDGSMQAGAGMPNGFGWKLSTAVLKQAFDLGNEDASPNAITFRQDGLKMYATGNTNEIVMEYDLSAAWDVSTASFNQSISSEGTTPVFVLFRPDGLTMYVGDSANDNVQQYVLATAWDISTATVSATFSFAGTENGITSAYFRPDGRALLIVGAAADTLFQYDLGTPWDVATAVLGDSFNHAHDGVQGLFFKTDGTRLYLADGTEQVIHEYTLTTPWDITTPELVATHLGIYNFNNGRDIFINPDGTKFYIVEALTDEVREYDLGLDMEVARIGQLAPNSAVKFADGSTQNSAGLPDHSGWRVATLIDNQILDITAQDTGMGCVEFRPNGLQMYLAGAENDSVYEYALTTPWDISTATFSQSFVVPGTIPNPSDLRFSPDGLSLYILDTVNDIVRQHVLNTAWDISTQSTLTTFSVSSEDSVPNHLYFKPDGRSFYVLGVTSGGVFRYDMTTAWDISTASYTGDFFDVTSETPTPSGLYFRPDGRFMLSADTGADTIIEYELSTPWDITTARFLEERELDASGPSGIYVNPDGTKLYTVDGGPGELMEYDMGLSTEVMSAQTLLAGHVEFAATTDTETLGNAIVYACTSTAAPRTLTLSLHTLRQGTPTRVLMLIVKDESGNAGTNNITIDTEGAETIDGANSVAISADYGAVRIYSDGSSWFTY